MFKKTQGLIIILAITILSCKKEAGEGGNSTITGKIWVRDYISNFTALNGEHAGSDLEVYIIYGNDATYGNRIKSGPDGVFEFKYLREGDYKLYVYSKDSTGTVGPPYSPSNPNLNAPKKAIYKNVSITKKKQIVDTGTIEILN